ncbi:hypothetical protein Mp_6g07570 [Marchantia polymorpha subsp. ruderalis]|uniref:Uncharacterized protein n=2 Tax=Marchantia polymorpha TaxID=3197 RepID=A0AAF6BPK2_MARPO|nr:hypothetical protein MARPO_0053s0071 [Marchantia polymorpha]BBN13936.1 hypothetical protein Mp_6g07570 [Marchantia polymorpha subsp. ruderalis]|eukprot:PTQ38137.1 hypothetical protein MARPO_0053s0071 [Marchantia polymorpha]
MSLNPGADFSQRLRVREVHRDQLLQDLALVRHALQQLANVRLDVPRERLVLPLGARHYQQNRHRLMVPHLLQHGRVVAQALVLRRGNVQHQVHMLGEIRPLLPVGQKLAQVPKPPVAVRAPSVRGQLQELLHRVEFGLNGRGGWRVRGPAGALGGAPFQEPLDQPQGVLGRLVLVRGAERDVALVDLERQRRMAPLLVNVLPRGRASARSAGAVGPFARRQAQNLADQRGLAGAGPADNENSQSLEHVACRQILVAGPHVRPHGAPSQSDGRSVSLSIPRCLAPSPPSARLRNDVQFELCRCDAGPYNSSARSPGRFLIPFDPPDGEPILTTPRDVTRWPAFNLDRSPEFATRGLQAPSDSLFVPLAASDWIRFRCSMAIPPI